jgi:4'-phosphopantetheinyl transferase
MKRSWAAISAPSSDRVELGPSDVHIWLVASPESLEPAQAARHAAHLSADETDRMRRFHHASDRALYLRAHALARTALSRYQPTLQPRDWRFVVNQHGRPEIAPGMAERPLRFNLSHTRGMAACAVTLGHDVGVDVEHVRPPSFDLAIARSHFAPAEWEFLESQPAETRREWFFAIWTLKEAYIKARGMGLALPLHEFAFRFSCPLPTVSHAGQTTGGSTRSNVAITIDPRLRDDANLWQFELFRPDQDHMLAVGCGRASSAALSVSLHPVLDDNLGDPNVRP